ncbi:GNAT family N-acetyltransferase [Bacillus sp. B-jedd]|uniref:GNAT family N-acetyltransferase n=1 Tax=Bacillus sp. B-jedd TaxID=1476857 RepID=UPI00051555AD|nr:GNAT family N-acetyltransferase [Bacillus sp. B-jedd]CEG25747.1 acetyltransferase [Bacillus sp. B-jedd]
MSNTIIKELQTKPEIASAYPVMCQLRTHLDEMTYLELVSEAQEKEGYKMFALYEGEEIAAVIGFQPMVTLYYGRFLWVCDLVTDSRKRSNGHGETLLSYIHQWAKQHNYPSIALSSGLQRQNAHKFYQNKMNYNKTSYVFKKDL